jgi:hypothetical protein
MATVYDICLAAGFNIVTAVAFLLVFAFLRLQPINDRVYFPKWYLKGMRDSPSSAGAAVTKYVNINLRSYLKFLSWIPAALKMPEDELIEHAGLDSVIYLRIYRTGYVFGSFMFSPLCNCLYLLFVVRLPIILSATM